MNYAFDFGAVLSRWEDIASGVVLTLTLSSQTLVLGLIVGIVGAWGRTAGSALLRRIVHLYVEVIRNTPFLVQLLLIYLGLPYLGLRLTPDAAALLAMVVNFGAYASEIVRAGIEAVPKGQIDAGRALGMTGPQIFILIVLTPAISAIFPALCGQFILIMLGSSVVSAISAEELTAVANNLQAITFRPFEIFIIVGAIYVALTLGFEALFHAIERRLFKYRFVRT